MVHESTVDMHVSIDREEEFDGLAPCRFEASPNATVANWQEHGRQPPDDGEVLSPAVAHDQECRRLLAQWRAGDETAKDRLIEINLPLIQRVAARKAWKYRRDSGEFTGLAWEAMVKAMDGLYDASHDNVGGYITTSVRRAIEHQVKKQSKRKEMSLDAAFLEGNEPTVDFYSSHEIWEELFACCDTEQERRILVLKSQRYTYKEIAALVLMRPTTVHYRLKSIMRRYDARNGTT